MIKLQNLINEFYINGFITTEDKSAFKKPENFDRFAQDKWDAYTGGNDWETGNTWAAVYFKEGYDELARIWFEIKYPSHLQKAVSEGMGGRDNPLYQEIKYWGQKATRRWIAEARKIRYQTREKILPDSYRWHYKDWKECFIEAMNSSRMKPFIKDWGVDRTSWKSMKPYKEEYGEDPAINSISQDTPTNSVMGKRECMKCHKSMGDAPGVEGVTSGICPTCKAEMQAMIKAIKFNKTL